MKKTIATLLILCMLCTLLAGCGSKPAPAATEEPKAEEPAPQEEPSFEEQMEAFLNGDKKEEPEQETAEAPAEPEPEETKEKEEKVPVLTLEPSIITDESFMQEMEEFLNKK